MVPHPVLDSSLLDAWTERGTQAMTYDISFHVIFHFGAGFAAAFLKPSTQLMAQKSEARAGWHMYS